jgi:hypothetical protein
MHNGQGSATYKLRACNESQWRALLHVHTSKNAPARIRGTWIPSNLSAIAVAFSGIIS